MCMLPCFWFGLHSSQSWVSFWYLATYFWTFFFAVDIYNSKHQGRWSVSFVVAVACKRRRPFRMFMSLNIFVFTLPTPPLFSSQVSLLLTHHHLELLCHVSSSQCKCTVGISTLSGVRYKSFQHGVVINNIPLQKKAIYHYTVYNPRPLTDCKSLCSSPLMQVYCWCCQDRWSLLLHPRAYYYLHVGHTCVLLLHVEEEYAELPLSLSLTHSLPLLPCLPSAHPSSSISSLL